MRSLKFYFIQRLTFVFWDVRLTQRSSCEPYSSNWSQNLCPSVKSAKIPAARRPATCNPTVVHISLLLLHFCHHRSSAFYLVAPQPSSAEMSTLCRISIPIMTCGGQSGRRQQTQRNSVHIPFEKSLHGCRLDFDGLLPRTSTSWCWWPRGWRGFWCCFFCTFMTVVRETAGALSFCFPLKANSFSSCNTT